MSEKIKFIRSKTFRSRFDNELYFSVGAFYGEKCVGDVCFRVTPRSIIADDCEVLPEFQNIGIATALYRWAETLSDRKARPSQNRSPAALKFWRNFARRKQWRKANFVFKGRKIKSMVAEKKD